MKYDNKYQGLYVLEKPLSGKLEGGSPLWVIWVIIPANG